jgi:iron uptake system component EfeO
MNNKFAMGAVAMSAALLSLTACGSSKTASGANVTAVKVTDKGCDPGQLTINSGPTTFKVTAEGSGKVTEYEVMKDDRILGEVENLTPGVSRTFSLNLAPGSYTLNCPNGNGQATGVLTVNGTSTTMASDTSGAVTNYRTYVQQQANDLVTRTEAFVNAVESNNIQLAQGLYPGTRQPYERIEPIAESFGDLDPAIDARADDTPVENITGFHRIEYALWTQHTTDGMKPVADKLLADVKTLRDHVQTFDIQPAQIANGANDLLGEVSQSKITGEEERYSHTDLYDFQANVEGAKAAIDAVRPLLDKSDPDLGKTIDARYNDVENDLKPYQRGSGWALYTDLTPDDTKKLSQAIDALAEPISQVSAKVVTK